MKSIVTFLILFSFFKTYGQELNDRIYLKEGDSIICKITSLKTDWVYYDRLRKKKVKSSHVHVDDIKFYMYQGIKTIPKEYKLWGRISEEGAVPNNVPVDKDQLALDTSLNLKDWHLGYLTFKNSKDTLFGWVKQDRWKGSPYEKIVFKKRADQPFDTFILDSLKSYKWGSITYKYFAYSGYSKLLHSGAIDIYKGYLQGNYPNYAPDCIVLKKGISKAKFISSNDAYGVKTVFYQGGILKKEAKYDIREYISDNPELLIALGKEAFRFEDIEESIVKYNNWAAHIQNTK
jgi:hypothetical protein